MKIVDVNVLIYAVDERTTHHDSARAWLEAAMNSGATIGLPTAVTVAFARLTTNPRVMREPLSIDAAVALVESWLTRPNVAVPVPTARHYGIVRDLVTAAGGVGGNLVSDAHLAALAVEYGAELCSFDTDFARFPGVLTVRPG